MEAAPLSGRCIGVTAERRADTLAKLLTRRGAEVIVGPTMETVRWADDTSLHAATEAVCEIPPDVVIVDTGAGVRAWIDGASEWGLRERLIDAFGNAAVFTRGAKGASAMRGAGVTVAAVSATERLGDLRAPLQEVALEGRRVVVQASGVDDRDGFVSWLAARGADVRVVAVHRWRLPVDRTPALALVDKAIDGTLDAVCFTSAPGVHNLFVLADEAGTGAALRAAFERGVIGACVGPVCAEAARRDGIVHPVFPDPGRLPAMVDALTTALTEAQPK